MQLWGASIWVTINIIIMTFDLMTLKTLMYMIGPVVLLYMPVVVFVLFDSLIPLVTRYRLNVYHQKILETLLIVRAYWWGCYVFVIFPILSLLFVSRDVELSISMNDYVGLGLQSLITIVLLTRQNMALSKAMPHSDSVKGEQNKRHTLNLTKTYAIALSLIMAISILYFLLTYDAKYWKYSTIGFNPYPTIIRLFVLYLPLIIISYLSITRISPTNKNHTILWVGFILPLCLLSILFKQSQKEENIRSKLLDADPIEMEDEY